MNNMSNLTQHTRSQCQDSNPVLAERKAGELTTEILCPLRSCKETRRNPRKKHSGFALGVLNGATRSCSQKSLSLTVMDKTTGERWEVNLFQSPFAENISILGRTLIHWNRCLVLDQFRIERNAPLSLDVKNNGYCNAVLLVEGSKILGIFQKLETAFPRNFPAYSSTA
jgi:hypothetical protein